MSRAKVFKSLGPANLAAFTERNNMVDRRRARWFGSRIDKVQFTLTDTAQRTVAREQSDRDDGAVRTVETTKAPHV